MNEILNTFLSKNDDYAVSSSISEIIFWDISHESLLKVYKGNFYGIIDLCISNCGKFAAFTSELYEIKVLEIHAEVSKTINKSVDSLYLKLRFSNSSKQIVALNHCWQIRIIEISSSSILNNFKSLEKFRRFSAGNLEYEGIFEELLY